jgi:hypothetical protein
MRRRNPDGMMLLLGAGVVLAGLYLYSKKASASSSSTTYPAPDPNTGIPAGGQYPTDYQNYYSSCITAGTTPLNYTDWYNGGCPLTAKG